MPLSEESEEEKQPAHVFRTKLSEFVQSWDQKYGRGLNGGSSPNPFSQKKEPTPAAPQTVASPAPLPNQSRGVVQQAVPSPPPQAQSAHVSVVSQQLRPKAEPRLAESVIIGTDNNNLHLRDLGRSVLVSENQEGSGISPAHRGNQSPFGGAPVFGSMVVSNQQLNAAEEQLAKVIVEVDTVLAGFQAWERADGSTTANTCNEETTGSGVSRHPHAVSIGQRYHCTYHRPKNQTAVWVATDRNRAPARLR